MKTLAILAAVLLSGCFVVACAGPGSPLAGVRLPGESFVGMPHGCGIWDTWEDRDPRVKPLGTGAPHSNTLGSAGGDICDEEVYRQKFYKKIPSKAQIEQMPATN